MYSDLGIIKTEHEYLVVDKYGRVFGAFQSINESKNYIRRITHYADYEQVQIQKLKDELRAEQTRLDRKEKLNRIFND